MGKLLRILLAAVLLLPPEGRAEEIRFQHFSSDDGLPDNSIRAAFQDSHGLMWFCTREGICMYDGMHFKPLDAPGCEILDGMALCLGEDAAHRLFFVTTRGIGYHDLETGRTETVHVSEGGLIGAADIAVGRDGKVWISAEDIFCWDPSREDFIDIPSARKLRSTSVTADDNGNLWFLDDTGSLYRLDSRDGSFGRIWESGASQRFSKQAIVSDKKGHILFSSPDGTVLRTDILTYATEPVYHTGASEIRCIALREDGSCWLGTEHGVFVADREGIRRYTHDVSDPFSLAGEDVWSMYADRQGNIWVGLFYNGLSLYRNSSGLVSRLYGRESGGPLSGNIIRPLMMVDERHLLVGAEDGGLVQLDLADDSPLAIPLRGGKGPEPNVQGLCLSDDEVWVATFGDGVFRMDLGTRKVGKNYLPGVSAATVLRTGSGEILVGTTAGLYRYVPQTDSFASIPEFEGNFIHALLEDRRGNLWIGSYGNGIWIGKEDGFRHITVRDAGAGLTSDYITSFREDSRHRIWVCTEAGGVCFTGLDETPDGSFRFRNLSRRNGLPSSITCCVLEDLDHVLWLTTTHGIVKLDPDDLSIREIYLERNGRTLNQFSYGSACATSSGRLFFGTSRGLIAFSPPGQGEREIPPVIITGIEGVGPEGPFRLTEEGHSTIHSEHIRVRYNDLATLTVRFSLLDYRSARSGLFETTLRGGRKTIRQMTTSGEATYTDLAPGKYTFTVRRMGVKAPEDRTLRIDIIPPFYRSGLAYALYTLLGLAVLFLIGWQTDRLRQTRLAHRVEQMETEKQKEIYDAKINFFTNITHEIRTPLTLIKMPLDKIIAGGNFPEQNREELLTMQANADRLLSLTNQLLDLRKMEKQEIRPVFLSNDLAALVRRVVNRFVPVARDQHIELEANLPDTPFPVDCAGEMVEKILGNLLSNAFKYGNGHIRVKLETLPGEDRVRVRVDSDGDRIPPEDAELIFEKFYQAESSRRSKGTGLGLPFARSLAALHGGTLTLDQSVKECNSFVLELPVHQDISVEMPIPRSDREEPEETSVAFDNLHHTVLVVEDDPQMRGYLAKELSELYNILVAPNGEDALEIIRRQRVDLVVSDIMMPGIDGCALCNLIKSTTEYSHIPVILLTAAVGMETRIETLEAGADGYIEKPFSIDLLRANIANLFKNRDIANRQFTQSPLSHFNSVVTGGMDQEFMERLHATVMKHLSEPDLNIETLTQELGTSKSTLYRKVTANTGLNINEYIRVSRLKKAAEMLASRKYRISEVAYMTGFSSPSYFATCFQKQFDISPSAFVKNLK